MGNIAEQYVEVMWNLYGSHTVMMMMMMMMIMMMMPMMMITTTTTTTMIMQKRTQAHEAFVLYSVWLFRILVLIAVDDNKMVWRACK
jgi:hypothetical protein